MKNIHVLPTDKPSRLLRAKSNGNIFLDHHKDFTFDAKYWEYLNIYITNDEEIKDGDYVVEITTSPRAPYIGKTFYPKNDGTVTEEVLKKYLLSVNYKDHYETIAHKGTCSKIILTDNEDLIKDGVQAIDDKFLEWFVKNPSCEFVEVEHSYVAIKVGKPSPKVYKIITKKEESKCLYDNPKSCENSECRVLNKCNGDRVKPKQETLEEVAEKHVENPKIIAKFSNNKAMYKKMFCDGAKRQQQQNKNLYSEEEVNDLLEMLKRSIAEINHLKYTYKDKGHCVKYLSDCEIIIEQFKKK